MTSVLIRKFDKIIYFFNEHKTLFNYVSSGLIGIPVSLVTGYLVLKNIDPELMGVWTAVLIFQNYAGFFGLGVISGLNRELPLAFGEREDEKAIQIAKSALGFSLFQSSIYVILLLGLLTAIQSDYYYKLSLVALCLRLIMGSYSLYLDSTFRTSSDFASLSKINWFYSLIRLIASPIILLGFEYYVLYFLIPELVRLLLLHLWRPLKVKPSLDFNVLKKLVAIGFPLFIMTYLSGLIDSVPRLFLLWKSGEYGLGIITPVLMIAGIFDQFVGILNVYFNPRWTYEYGSDKNIKKIWLKVKKTVSYAIAIIILTILPVYFFSEELIKLFPKYESSAQYFIYLLLIAPLSVFSMPAIIFVLLKEYKWLSSILFVRALLIFSFIAIFYLLLSFSDYPKILFLTIGLTNFSLLVGSFILINKRILMA